MPLNPPSPEEYDRIRHTYEYQQALARGMAALEASKAQSDAEVKELERLFKLTGED